VRPGPPPACSSPIRLVPRCTSVRPSRSAAHPRSPWTHSGELLPPSQPPPSLHASLATTTWDSYSCPSGPNQTSAAAQHCSRRPPPPAAGVPHRRPPPKPGQPPKSTLEDPQTITRPLPPATVAGLAGIWPKPRRPPPQGRHCKVRKHSGVISAKEGYSCEPQKTSSA
jgi:hypothetical protein